MILICYIIASISFVVLFALQYLSTLLLNKLHPQAKIAQYLLQIWCLIAFVLLYLFGGLNGRVLSFNHFFAVINVIYILAAVLPTAIIISSRKDTAHKKSEWILLGITMEIPQRLFMQNFFFVLLGKFIPYTIWWLPILLNALLWAQFILIQEKMYRNKLKASTVLEIISSVWFSIMVGILYEYTDNILLPMMAHGCERALSEVLRSKRGKLTKNTIINS